MATDHNFKVKKGLHVLGAEGVYLTDTNTRLHEGSGNALRITTGTGYIDIGSMNSGWVHMQANKNIYILPAGHVSIDGNLQPYTDSARTLGTDALRWSHIYVDAITLSDNINFNASTAYLRNQQDNSGQIAIQVKNSSGTTREVRWDAANNANGAWRATTNGGADLGLTNKIWNNLFVNTIKVGTSNLEVIDSSRNITAGTISSGAITASSSINLTAGTIQLRSDVA